jgi:Na+:H+ antiporter, NhaA family
MILTRLFREFFESEKAGGLILVIATIISLTIANSAFGNSYSNLFHTEFGGHSLVHWINEGLMTIFFLLIGLELEREIYAGELSNPQNALLPIFGALGGMIMPVALYTLLNFGTDAEKGVGIPMATDIAFTIGILSLLGKRVPASLKIFLTALAVIDDLGAIIIIAVFYSGDLDLTNLIISLSVFFFLIILNRLKIRNLIPYLAGGIVMWYFMLNSGIHATITGVLLAFAIPFGDGSEKSPSFKIQHFLHKPVSFVILPLFALANTCIVLGSNWHSGLGLPASLGIMAGLIIGKPVGIFLFSFLAVVLGFCALPEDIKWNNIIGAGMLGGIGFTMSIFITLLAFNNPETINSSKIAILMASMVSCIIGLIWLRLSLKKPGELADQFELGRI